RKVPGSGDLQARFVYDNHDQVRKVTRIDDHNTAGISEQYYYLGKQRFLAVSSDASGNTTGWRLYFAGGLVENTGVNERSSAFPGGVRLTTTSPCGSSCTTEVVVTHTDSRGNLIAATDQSGQLHAHYAYG